MMNTKTKKHFNKLTPAEYDESGKCILIKSAKIDGKKLKADTFYILKNKKFVKA
jgi:hypothetical protein